MRKLAIIVGVITVLAAAGAGSAASGSVRLTVVAENGSVTGYGTHFRCQSTCSLPIAAGSSILLVAQPVYGFRFTRWDGACRGKTSLCVVAPTAATTARAFYAPKLGRVLVAVGGAGTVRAVRRSKDTCSATAGASCKFSRPLGDDVELAAVPAAGGSFSGWGGACEGTVGRVCDVSVHTGSRQVSAAFATAPTASGSQQQLTVQATSTLVNTSIPGFSCAVGSCHTLVPTGTLVELTPDKQSTPTRTSWTGGCSGYGYTCELVVDGPVTVTSIVAAYTPPVHPSSVPLTVKVLGHGVVTDSSLRIDCTPRNTQAGCQVRVPYGAAVRLTASRGPGYHFSSWFSPQSLCHGKQTSCDSKAKGYSQNAIAAYFKPSK